MNTFYQNSPLSVTGAVSGCTTYTPTIDTFEKYSTRYSNKIRLLPLDVTNDPDFEWARNVVNFDKSNQQRLYNVGDINGECDRYFVQKSLMGDYIPTSFQIDGFFEKDGFTFCLCGPHKKAEDKSKVSQNTPSEAAKRLEKYLGNLAIDEAFSKNLEYY